MEKDFSNENMEEFLRQSAEGFRMRPSSKVWEGISSHLIKRKRRAGWILGSSLMLVTVFGYHVLNNTTKKSYSNTTNYISKTTTPTTKQEASILNSLETSASLFTPVKGAKKTVYQDNVLAETTSTTPTTLTQPTALNDFSPTIVDSYFEAGVNPEFKSPTEDAVVVSDPLSIESVVNTYKPIKRKLGWQAYFTPTISYRRINDAFIDNFIPHKPAFGFELGMAAKYRVSNNVKLRGGMQFNVNRYEIKTYDSYAQMATIRLNDGAGTSYSRSTNYNNYSGRPNWLQNFYFQVSTPVGVELKIKGDDKVQFGIASTIQPTYLLGDRAYVISNDYKNYVEMPNLVRRWNVNTHFETFVAYSTGHLNWQVGPQVRYQMLSSYVKKYPVKENLFDFGLKVGLSINKQ